MKGEDAWRLRGIGIIPPVSWRSTASTSMSSPTETESSQSEAYNRMGGDPTVAAIGLSSSLGCPVAYSVSSPTAVDEMLITSLPMEALVTIPEISPEDAPNELCEPLDASVGLRLRPIFAKECKMESDGGDVEGKSKLDGD